MGWFDFHKNVVGKGLVHEAVTFRQSDYIAQIVHNDWGGQAGGQTIGKKSEYSEGVCFGLSLITLQDWMEKGVGAGVINSFGSDNIAQHALDLQDAGEGHSAFRAAMTQAGYLCRQHTRFSEPKAMAESASRAGFCLLAVYFSSGGHAIVCNGQLGALFDPNAGYYQSLRTNFFIYTLQSLFHHMYPTANDIRLLEFAKAPQQRAAMLAGHR